MNSSVSWLASQATRRIPAASARTRVVLGALFAFALLSLALFGADRAARRGEGLQARYAPRGRPVVDVVDPDVSSGTIRRHAAALRLRAFDVEWTGFVSVTGAGWYQVAVASSGTAAVHVDTRPVLAARAPRRETSLVWLARGRHLLAVHYSHRRGTPGCDLFLSPQGEPLRVIPPASFSTVPPSPFRTAWAPALTFVRPFLAIAWATLLSAAVIGLALAASRRALRASDLRLSKEPGLVLVLTVAGVLFALGIDWGLPSPRSWAVDEVLASHVFAGLRSAFSDGWFSRYPPVHFYLVGAMTAPLYAAGATGLVAWTSVGLLTGALLLARLLSVVMGLGTVVLVYLLARFEHGRASGLAAAAIIAVTVPFTYYSKTANLDVPYTFWFVLSLLFYARVWRWGRPRDCYLFAAAAALSVCTKDQAYGLYVLPGFAVAARLAYLEVQRASPGHRVSALLRSLATPAKAALLAGGLFAVAHNLAFNWLGFQRHVAIMQTMGNHYGGVFDPTPSGHASMLVAATSQVGGAMGWPLFALSLAGLAVELRSRQRNRALWLLLPALSYYLFFISVLLYHYDRFFMPVCAILAVHAGRSVAGLVTAEPGRPAWLRRWGIGTAVTAFAWSFLHCAALDHAMLVDSRYRAEDWLHGHVPRTAVVGVTSVSSYLPRLHDFRTVRVRKPGDLQKIGPAFVVVNADLATRFAVGSPQWQLHDALRGGRTGYSLVYRDRPQSWSRALVRLGRSQERQDAFTNLDKVNPTIEVYQRAEPVPARPD